MSPRRHMIFTNGRSGSNYLVNLLNAHPHVTNYGEVRRDYNAAYRLHKKLAVWGGSAEEHLDAVLASRSYFQLAQSYSAVRHLLTGRKVNRKRWSNTISLGVKEFGIAFERQGLHSYLADRPHISVVSLVRENTFDRVLSIHRLAKTRQVAASDTEQPASDAEISIPVDEFLRDLSIFELEKEYQQKIVDSLPPSQVLRVTYEALFASETSQQDFRRELFEFLQVADADVASTHRKLSRKPIGERLSNYAEIRAAVAPTRFSHYLP